MKAVSVAAALALVACSGGGTSSAPPSTTSTTTPTTTSTTLPADFYTPPDPLPEGRPGDVIRTEVVPAASGLKVWRVLYRSTGVDDKPVAVSGLVLAPATAAPAGGFPVVAYAHGTTGIADACAPSKSDEAVRLLSLVAQQGYVVAATDYEGLGTPGTHPYLVGRSEGRSVLDAARLAQRFTDAGAGTRVVVAGHSQGGHAGLFAADIAPEYAPELDIAGVAVSAPPADLRALRSNAVAVPQYQGFFALIAAGWNAADPAARPDTLLTPEFVKHIGVVERGCADTVLAEYASVPPPALKVDPDAVEPWRRLTDENSVGQRKIAPPVLILQGQKDDLVLPDVTRTLQRTMCAAGSSVELKEYAEANHLTVVSLSAFDQLRWVHDRLAGTPVQGACA